MTTTITVATVFTGTTTTTTHGTVYNIFTFGRNGDSDISRIRAFDQLRTSVAR
jgi:hypothetical protein